MTAVRPNLRCLHVPVRLQRRRVTGRKCRDYRYCHDLRERPSDPLAASHAAQTGRTAVVPLSGARLGRPRLSKAMNGPVRVEVRLPVETAALVYEAALERDETVSATVDALLRDALESEVSAPNHT